MKYNVGVYAKAVVAGLAAGAALAVTLISDGSVDLNDALAIAAAVLGGSGVTYAVPNSDKE